MGTQSGAGNRLAGRRRRRIATAVGSIAAAAIAATAMLSAAAPANAAPAPKKQGAPYIVTFGDSYTANYADTLDLLSDCNTSPTSWPSQLHRRTGAPVMNLACSGSRLSGGQYNIYDQARKAVSRGGLNANTRAVFVQIGFNDFNGGPDLFTRCLTISCPGAGSFPGLNAGNYASKLRPLVNYVRYYAPRANISIVGYPQVFGPKDRDICANIGGARVTLPNTSQATIFMNRLQGAQQGAANRLGVGFVDLKAPTANHSMCSPQPWVNGIMSPHPGIAETALVGHPTPAGDAAAARAVAASR